MPLTDIAVRQARPKDKIYTLTDGRGLGLCVKPGGGKSWHFRYYWSGKQKRIALGKYPEISLKEARGRCEAARTLVAQGTRCVRFNATYCHIAVISRDPSVKAP